MEKTSVLEEQERRFAETVWLNYFNQYLFEHGCITKKEYCKMISQIANRKKTKNI